MNYQDSKAGGGLRAEQGWSAKSRRLRSSHYTLVDALLKHPPPARMNLTNDWAALLAGLRFTTSAASTKARSRPR